MKAIVLLVSVFVAGAAYAHDALAPHQHPHATSVLPDAGPFGIAVLVLALGITAYAHFKRG
jgi:hypothetical protein